MNNLIANFNQILDFAKQYNMPITKKRAILREYLQVKILEMLYQQKLSLKLSFIGGTSLRLLRGLDRFSEDLDFDNLGLSSSEIDSLIQLVYKNLHKENILINLYKNIRKNKSYYEFRFPKLLNELKISNDPQEKLMIKFDYSMLWQKQTTKPVLLNKYGFVFYAITNSLNQILAQKMQTYLARKQTQPRDIYDMVWLRAQGADLDEKFLADNNLKRNLKKLVVDKYNKERNKLLNYKHRLAPFLINENNIIKLDLLPSLL